MEIGGRLEAIDASTRTRAEVDLHTLCGIHTYLEAEVGERAEREADPRLLEVGHQLGVVKAVDAVINALYLRGS